MDPDHRLANEIHDLFAVLPGATVSSAESCTGGGVARELTAIPGSSDYFVGGVIAYANSVKIDLLGVPREIIESAGAVSEECARAMAEGARELFGSDYAMATTGIAGPSGATATKPVGLVYISLASPSGTLVERLLIEGGREAVMNFATASVLELLIQALTGQMANMEAN